MFTVLVSGVVLGLSAGLSPGPMLALVLAQTLRHGSREGCKIALSPLLTDAPIILVALGLAAKLSELRLWLGVVSMAGAIFVAFLAWESFGAKPPDAGGGAERSRSWLKGIVTNLLNPHPWIFWMTVGAAVLAKALAQGWEFAVAFLAGFYLLLVGSKVLVALVAGRSANLLAGKGYRIVMRVLGLMLAIFAVVLFREGLKQAGVI